MKIKTRKICVGFIAFFLLLMTVAFNIRTSMAQLIPVPHNTKQTELTQEMRSICIGRLMMDIPAQYYPDPEHNKVRVRTSFNLDSRTNIELTNFVTLDEFNQIVNASWDEVNSTQRYHDLTFYKTPPQKISPFKNAYILAYGFREIYGTDWVNGEIIKVDSEILSESISYYWISGTMFKIVAPSWKNDDIANDIIANLSKYDWSNLPKQPGICLYQAFFSKYYDAGYEGASLGIDFTDQFGISLITTMGSGEAKNYTLLSSYEKPNGIEKDGDRVTAFKVYRAEEYITKNFTGEELVRSESDGFIDSDGTPWMNGMYARWEVAGDKYIDNPSNIKGEELYYPDIIFQMHVTTKTGFKPEDIGGYPPADKGQSGIPSKDEFFEVWDAMVNSIRPYPGAFTPEPKEEAPEEPPMPNTSTISRDKQFLDDFLKNG